jgi:hypothetical protein
MAGVVTGKSKSRKLQDCRGEMKYFKGEADFALKK